MATIDHTLALPRTRPHLISRRTQFVLLFVGLSLSWFVGVGAFFWPAVAFLFALSFLANRRLDFPRYFGIWLVFLVWVLISAFGLDGGNGGLVFAQRYLGILAATILFLFVFNASRSSLPDSTVVNGLAVYWAILVVGGVVAILAPSISYHTPAEQLVPGGLLSNPFVHGTLHVRFADIQSLFGFPIGRPAIFFGATNAWGAMVAILTPFALAALEQAGSPLRRRLLQGLLVVSVVPIVVSLNRGMWLALGVTAVYVGVRFALRLKVRSLAWLLGLVAVVGALLFATPLGALTTERIATPSNSNESRGSIYKESIAGIVESPLIGHGGPRPNQRNIEGPPLGTHSHLLFLGFSHGIPALLLFLGWLGLTLVRSSRMSGPPFWSHVAILVFFIESPYYLLEAHLVVVMVAAALVWRVLASPSPTTDPNLRASRRPVWA